MNGAPEFLPREIMDIEECADPGCDTCFLMTMWPGETRAQFIARMRSRYRGALTGEGEERPRLRAVVLPDLLPAPTVKLDEVPQSRLDDSHHAAQVQCRRCNAWRRPNTPCAGCVARQRARIASREKIG